MYLVAVEKEGQLLKIKTTHVLGSILIKSALDQMSLLFLKFDNTVLHGALNQDSMYFDRILLTNTMSSIDSLHFDERVPERIQDDDLRSSDQVEASIAGFQGDEHDVVCGVLALGRG